MLSVVILSVDFLSVIMLSVIILNVIAPRPLSGSSNENKTFLAGNSNYKTFYGFSKLVLIL
jgi:hypothetical protein